MIFHLVYFYFFNKKQHSVNLFNFIMLHLIENIATKYSYIIIVIFYILIGFMSIKLSDCTNETKLKNSVINLLTSYQHRHNI